MINADVSIVYNNLELWEKAPCNKMKKKSFRKKYKVFKNNFFVVIQCQNTSNISPFPFV